jgi:transposase-like protein
LINVCGRAPCPASSWSYEQQQAKLSKEDLLNQKVPSEGTLYVDGDWTKEGWKKRLEESIGKKLTQKQWKKLRYKSVCVVATKEKVILDFEITDSLPDSKALIPLMERIKNRFPKGKIKRIVSDEDNAIIEAVKTVFPEVSHSFCVFHQLKNVSKKYSKEFKTGDEMPIEDEIVYNGIIQLIKSNTVDEVDACYQNMLNSESYLELSKASHKAISYTKDIYQRNINHLMKGFTPVTNNTMEQTFSLIRDIIENVRSFKTKSGLTNFCYNLFTYFNNRYFATGKWRGFSPIIRAKFLHGPG